MEQLAQQRKRFMDNMESSGIKIDDIEGGGSSGAGAKETGPTTAVSGAVTGPNRFSSFVKKIIKIKEQKHGGN